MKLLTTLLLICGSCYGQITINSIQRMTISSPANTGNYYVSTTGNDANTGTLAEPFQSISKINSLDLTGKIVLFKGGETFIGNILINDDNVFLGSYGTGQATISAGTGSGLIIQDCDSVTVNYLKFQGSGVTTSGVTSSTGYGIRVLSTVVASGYLYGIVIDSNIVDGFRYGIEVMTNNGNSGGPWIGYNGLQMTNNEVRFIAHTGIRFNAFCATSNHSIHKNIYLFRNNLHDLYGNGPEATSYADANYGTGIRTNFCDSGIVEYCRVDTAGRSGSTWGYPANFEAENASNIIWQYNESARCKMVGPIGFDGAGFDVWDGDCQNMTVQYNYIHNNDGYGIGGGNAGFGLPNTGNVARFNLLVNNNAKGLLADVQYWNELTGAKFYNNTVYSNLNGSKLLDLQNTTGNIFANNIFVSTGTRTIGTISSTTTKFLNNSYYVNGGTSALSLIIGGVAYNTLSGLQGAGYEKISSTTYGLAGLPTFVNGGDTTVFLMAQNVSNQGAYNITGIGAGGYVDMTTYTGAVGNKDFQDKTITVPVNIGAVQ